MMNLWERGCEDQN